MQPDCLVTVRAAFSIENKKNEYVAFTAKEQAGGKSDPFEEKMTVRTAN